MPRIDPDAPADEGQEGDAHEHPTDAAQHIEGEGKSRCHLEMLGIATGDAMAAVTDDQLP